jgi:PAS domain S-box-containing protein
MRMQKSKNTTQGADAPGQEPGGQQADTPPGVHSEDVSHESHARLIRDVVHIVTAVTNEDDLERTADAILAQILRIGANSGHVYQVDEGNRRLTLLASRNIPPGLVAKLKSADFEAPLLATKAVQTRKVETFSANQKVSYEFSMAHLVLEAANAKEMVSIPLIFQERLLGVLTATYPETHKLVAEDLDVLAAVGEIFAMGLQNVRDRTRSRALARSMEAVRRAALNIETEKDVYSVLQSLVDEARILTHARYGALGIVAKEGGAFLPWVFSGMKEETVKAIGRFPRPVGLLGAVPAEGKSIRLKDLHQDPRFKGFPEHHPPMKSFLGVPVSHHGTPVGNLYLTDKQGSAEFTLEDQQMAETLAQHAALAIEHSRLFGRIEEDRRWLETVIQHSPAAILIAEDPEGKRLRSNRKTDEFMGFPLDSGKGLSQYENIFKDSAGEVVPLEGLPLSRVLRGETISQEEYTMGKGARQTTFLLDGAPIRDDQGRIQGAVVIADDITRLKELEQLRQEWTSIVAHDLRQPLTSIQSFAEILIARLDDEILKRAAQNILIGAQRMARMTEDILDISRLQANQLQLDRETVAIPEIVRGVVERMAEKLKDNPVHVNVHGTISPVFADAQRVEQICINLLSNAVNYGSPGRPITIDIASNGEVEVSITNEGPGIEERHFDKLFDRFERSAAQKGSQGFGLGLYISKGLIEAHGGTIEAKSVLNEHTTFTFRLPTADQKAS